jgi:hypothetical protein
VSKRLMVMAIAMAGVLILAGCGDKTTSPDERADAPLEAGPDAETTPTAVAADSGAPTADEIAELLFGFGDIENAEAAQAQYEQEERERQELIAECMAAQGFEYTPVDYSQFAVFGPEGDLDPTSREYAETYGFGFSTFEDQAIAEPAADFVDPNQEYVEGLSESASDAYYAALYGQPPEIDESMTEDEINAMLEENPDLFQPQGCEGEAFQSTSDGLESVYTALSDQFEDLFQRVEADPRVVAWEADWASCMADAGYDFGSMEEIYDELSRRMEPLWASQDPTAGMTQAELEALSPEEMEELFSSPPQMDQDLLDEMRTYELAVAVASFDCGGFDQDELFTEVFREYQDQFIQENLGTIQELLAEDGVGG